MEFPTTLSKDLEMKDNLTIRLCVKWLESFNLSSYTLWDSFSIERLQSYSLTSFFCLLSFCLLPVRLSYGYEAPRIDLSAIAQIESSGDPSAIGDSRKALGLFQLHAPVIADYNKANGCSELHKSALNAITATQIARWYLDTRIPQILRSRGLEPTTERILRCYNAGCGSLRHNPSPITQTYLKKYRRLTYAANAKTKAHHAPGLYRNIRHQEAAKVDISGLLRGIKRSGSALRSGACEK